MKSFLVLLILAAVSLAQAPASAPPQDEGARKAKALLDQMVQALGGQKWLTYETFTQEGRTYGFYHGEPNSSGVLFWRFWKFPDKDRVELTKQRDVVYLNVGDEGYEITYKGTAPMEQEQLQDTLRREHHSLEIVMRQWLNAPGSALFYDGPAVAEQKPTQSVTIMNAQNDAVTIFIDSNTLVPVKKSFTWRDPQYKDKVVEDEIYDNYRDEGGILAPHTILRRRNGEITSQRFLSSVKFNVPMPDRLFQAGVTYDPYKEPKKK